MMKKKIVFCVFLVICVAVVAQDVKIFEKKGKFGLKNKSDNVIVKAQYTKLESLDNGSFLVKADDKLGVLSKSGREILPTTYDEVKLFSDGYFLVKNHNKYGLVDQFGKTILPIQYDGLEKLNDYLFILKDNKKEGILSSFGSLLLPVQYDDIEGLSEGLFSLQLKNKKGIMDKQGNIIIPANYDKIEEVSSMKMYKVNIDNHLGLVSFAGKVLAEPIFDEIDGSQGNYVLLKKGNKFGFLINDVYIPAEYDKILFTQLDLGVICVRSGKMNGFITIDGKVIPPVYENISRFSPSGLAFVERGGKLMFVDIYGKEHALQEVNVVNPK